MGREEFGAGIAALKFSRHKVNLHPTDKVRAPYIKHVLSGLE
jgi:hypothetical protein